MHLNLEFRCFQILMALGSSMSTSSLITFESELKLLLPLERTSWVGALSKFSSTRRKTRSTRNIPIRDQQGSKCSRRFITQDTAKEGLGCARMQSLYERYGGSCILRRIYVNIFMVQHKIKLKPRIERRHRRLLSSHEQL